MASVSAMSLSGETDPTIFPSTSLNSLMCALSPTIGRHFRPGVRARLKRLHEAGYQSGSQGYAGHLDVLVGGVGTAPHGAQPVQHWYAQVSAEAAVAGAPGQSLLQLEADVGCQPMSVVEELRDLLRPLHWGPDHPPFDVDLRFRMVSL